MQEMKVNVRFAGIVLWLLLFSLSFLVKVVSGNPLSCEHPVNGATACGKGTWLNGTRCEPCLPGYYQDASNHNCRECKACTSCPDGSISQDRNGCSPFQDTQCSEVEDFSTPSAKGAITHSEVSSSSNPTTTVATEPSSSSSSSSSSSNSDDRQTSTAPPPSQEKAREPYKIPFVIACFLIATLVLMLVVTCTCLVKIKKVHAGENRGSDGQTPSGHGISGGSYSTIPNGNTTEMANRSTSNSCAEDG